jgi:hypothetical protein
MRQEAPIRILIVVATVAFLSLLIARCAEDFPWAGLG